VLKSDVEYSTTTGVDAVIEEERVPSLPMPGGQGVCCLISLSYLKQALVVRLDKAESQLALASKDVTRAVFALWVSLEVPVR